MAIVPYLAMTAAEFQRAPSLPARPAWMACHFSPYSTGLSNLPRKLPANTLLILNDRTPLCGQDPEEIGKSLQTVLNTFRCPGLLLDFQREDCPETKELVRHLLRTLSCPICVSQPYAEEAAAVLLPPIPVDMTTEAYLAPWQGQTIWLEASFQGKDILLTREGPREMPSSEAPANPTWEDAHLHCHYQITETADGMRFHMFRTPSDVIALLSDAEQHGVREAIGLYQELGRNADMQKLLWG